MTDGHDGGTPGTCPRLLGWLMTRKRKTTLLHTPCILERFGGKRRPCSPECVGISSPGPVSNKTCLHHQECTQPSGQEQPDPDTRPGHGHPAERGQPGASSSGTTVHPHVTLNPAELRSSTAQTNAREPGKLSREPQDSASTTFPKGVHVQTDSSINQ